MRALFARLLAINWLRLPSTIRRAWRQSLQFRAVGLSAFFAGVAIVGVGLYMSLAISNDLFHSRLNQVLTQSEHAQESAQRIFDSGVATDRAGVANLVSSSLVTIRDTSSSSLLAFYRVPTAEVSLVAPQDFASPELSGSTISLPLRTSVRQGDGAQFWQSISLEQNGRSVPGVVVGSLVTVPNAGDYELYIAYSFAEAEQTLAFITQVLWIAGIGLLVLISVIAWFVARMVVRPIKVAAQTSQQLAAGDLSARVPELGEDVLTTLARNFNDMARSMQVQVTSLEELSSMQQRFVADVSHELKTPLTVVRLAADLLYQKREDFAPNVRDSIDQLHGNLDRFSSLLNELLEISRYDAKTIKLELEPTNIVHLASGVAAELEPLAQERGIEISIKSPGGHGEVIVDPRRIRRVLVNLLGNAIEHGEGRPVTIEIDSNSTAVSVVVEDHGTGLTEEQAAQVFNRFYRADPSRKRTLGGTGLGLSIALEDSRIHNGTLDVWSRLGEGSRFRLTIPRDPGVRWTASPLPLAREDSNV